MNDHDDPMAFIRGQYDSEMSALRRINKGGGLVSLWARGMADAIVPDHTNVEHEGGLTIIPDIKPGDVGVIRRATVCGTDEAAAIWSGERWVSLGVRGIEAGPAVVLRCWRVTG